MRKIYAFLAAALMSVSAFALDVPSDAVIQSATGAEAGQVVVAFYVPSDMACYNIVLTGSFNGWSDQLAKCPVCEPLDGYDGWYVTAYTPEENPDAEKGYQAKPIMKDALDQFVWDYQVGAATVLRGGVQVVQGAYAGEIDMINYGTDAPNVFTVDAWKKNPCTAKYHNYRFVVINDGCDGFAIPNIAGSFNGWKFEQFQVDMVKTQELGAGYYYYDVKAAEGSEYQLVSSLMDNTGAIVDSADWKDIAYLWENVDGVWGRINNGANLSTDTLGTSLIVFDIREANLAWARCLEIPSYPVLFAVKLPALNCPDSVEVIGGFDDWKGTLLTPNPSTGFFEAEFEAKENQFFKLRSKGAWDQEIEIYDNVEDTWAKIADGQFVLGQIWQDGQGDKAGKKVIELEWNDPEGYRWTVKEEGIEDVVLVEKATKVMVDGVLYIIRDNKMFNIQGTQVR